MEEKGKEEERAASERVRGLDEKKWWQVTELRCWWRLVVL